MKKLLIKGCSIVPVKGPVIDKGAIAIAGDRLAYVGREEGLPSGWEEGEIIRAEGKVALPGLVNIHTHAAMTLFRGYADDLPLRQWLEEKIWPVENKLDREDIYWGTQLALAEMIRSGTTTFADMYFHMDVVARAAEEAGVRACLSQGLIGLGGGGEERLRAAESLVREWHGAGDGRITIMLGPHAPYTCPPDYLRKVVEAAAKLGVGLHIHLAETRQEVEEIRSAYGSPPVAHVAGLGLFDLPTLAAHCVHLTEEEIAILAEKKVGVAHCPESNLKLASGVAPIAAMLAAGVTVGIGTDGAASNNNLDLLEETRTAALLAKGISGDPNVLRAEEALALATINGARALGLEKEIGTLEAGKKADVILLNTRQPHWQPANDLVAHVVYSARGSDVDTVIVNGRILMAGGQLKTLDEERIYRETNQRIRALQGLSK
ncbi:amidohydrolase [Thermanaeromonas sp. C210]|uniref:amidohydrolase n=1 Tax=Thermanaeromonas sp. C210 TaxID=2731925 RepID=UPI00155C845C|nr:amidohydrolase [Thermanaeromonas sp. C210]GFN23964.1 5-methylthioadenosine/S-adenosylhomocysteine deaminase [Thermanaeromonas sp. C210]